MFMNLRITLTRALLAILAAGVLSSCTTSVSLKETWKSPEAPATVYRKLLVMGISPNPSLRETFENILTTTLREHGVEAVRSYTLIKDLNKFNSSELQGLAREAGADGVIITRGISKEEHVNYQYAMGTVERKTVVYEDAQPDSSTTIVMSGIGIAPRETDIESADLLTRLFDVRSDRQVWLAKSSLYEAEDRAGACWRLSALLVKALSEDHLIEINSREFHIPSL
jgi:hypothetical protein